MGVESTIEPLEANLEAIRHRMGAAAQRGGRDPEAVRLLAVTKKVPAEAVRALAGLGVQDFGENRVQSLLAKQMALGTAVRWHLIGTLQRNKARKALQACDTIHSADSLDLLRTLERIAAELGRKARVFLECNVSGEGSKRGFPPEGILPALREAKRLPRVETLGLMTMAPLASDPERARPLFRRLRELRDGADRQGLFAGRGQLSMGMTQDFEVAIEEGADWVRIGSALFEGVEWPS